MFYTATVAILLCAADVDCLYVCVCVHTCLPVRVHCAFSASVAQAEDGQRRYRTQIHAHPLIHSAALLTQTPLGPLK